MSDLLINGKDTFTTWGVRMGDDFISQIYAPVPMKEFIENKSRLEDGKQVLYDNPKVDERDVTLAFTLQGNSSSDYASKYKSFINELKKGKVEIQVPALGPEIYRLTYQKSVSYGLSMDRSFSKISIKMNEPNPNNRS